jgi:hypothetical protein
MGAQVSSKSRFAKGSLIMEQFSLRKSLVRSIQSSEGVHEKK